MEAGECSRMRENNMSVFDRKETERRKSIEDRG
jgi:hypothetical protein